MQTKIENESPNIHDHIQEDIYGSITLLCGPIWYFMILIDASTRWSYMFLLFSQNITYAKLFAQIIRLRI